MAERDTGSKDRLDAGERGMEGGRKRREEMRKGWKEHGRKGRRE